ncbi:MAG: archaeal histone, partial [Methanohalophilus sp.]
MTIIPVAPVGRVIREAGAERISESASEELARILEE